MEKLPMTWIKDRTQKHMSLSTVMITAQVKICLQCWKKRLNTTMVLLNSLLVLGDLNYSRVIIHYVMGRCVVSCECWCEESWRIFGNSREVDCGGKWLARARYSIRMKPLYSGNQSLKGLSSIRKPSQCQASRILRTEQSCLGAMLKATVEILCDLAQWKPRAQAYQYTNTASILQEQ